MDIQVYSLPQRKHVRFDKVVDAVGSLQTMQQFYDNCVGLFPLVLSPMSQDEMDGQRALTDWQCDRGTETDRYLLIELMKQADRENMLAGIVPPTADNINFASADAPLLKTWKKFGKALYGRGDFGFRTADTLRRSVAPAGPVVGGRIHDDMRFKLAYQVRAFSILSICADQDFTTECEDRPWWSTHWHDMRNLPLHTHINLRSKNSFPETQAYLAATCPAQPIPSGQHVLMPTWMLHVAGGKGNAMPAHFDRNALQGVKAYISHAVLERPLGDLLNPMPDCCYPLPAPSAVRLLPDARLSL